MAPTALPLDAAVALGAGVLEAAAAAHAAGLVHRDLKPSNILLEARPGERPLPRITDFGLVKALAAIDRGATATGLMMGTPGYMPPEQYRDAKRVDARGDVFALGVILYELVCGARPFGGRDPITLHHEAAAAAFQPPRSRAPALSPARAAAIVGALSPRPEVRPADARALLALWRRPPTRAPAAAGRLRGPR